MQDGPSPRIAVRLFLLPRSYINDMHVPVSGPNDSDRFHEWDPLLPVCIYEANEHLRKSIIGEPATAGSLLSYMIPDRLKKLYHAARA